MQKVGFIGTGVMGKHMASHIQKAGYPLFIYTRTRSKANDLLEAGAMWCETPAELASKTNIVFTIIGEPKDVEQVYMGKDGLFEGGHPGQVMIDMTTSKPSLAKTLYQKGKEKGIAVLDAPVSGGDIGAKLGKLSIMVGGDQKIYDEVKPLFDTFGENIVYQGEAGTGQHTKMSNQIAIASNMIGVCEAVAYTKTAGLDPEKVLESIALGAAGSWSLSNLAPRMMKKDYAPGFFIKHFIKDMRIALEEAERMNLDLPGLSMAKEMYEELAEQGEEESGTQALFKRYNSKAGSL
ncbi:NAD(P)-dependent oxidoreductase [Domibacillus epiphyticus]|uniref:Oxidoreductase n=1 Tax=Domibacillus epiphyticus TaxID=1714355 RepID=A0A1V2A5E2_9BACI|nr:NAD(P)-dependent oxidoreductase [Domibacillus epiphyticus]OMP66229.1 oxidoreductase [Domibacillus epiphyticus]